MRSRPNRNRVVFPQNLSGDLVNLGNKLNLVAKELKAQRVLGVGWIDVHHVAAHAEGAASEVKVVAVVLDIDKGVDEVVALEWSFLVHVGRKAGIVLRRTDTVDAGDARHHNHVAAREQRRRRLMAQHLDLFVNGSVLLDIGVALRHVGLGLVVVVVRNKVDHCVMREELLELAGELRGERLVGCHHERGLAERLNGLCHGIGLA